jgi:dephospho-CoA kinase
MYHGTIHSKRTNQPSGHTGALADDIIDNSSNLAELQDKVEALHKKYLKLAGSG